MSRSSYLFAGLFGSFAISCFALVLAPQGQLGGLEADYTEEEGANADDRRISDIYPVQNEGGSAQGRAIYIREGCMYCHTQQVRDPQHGLDLERGWGVRRTVARDYLFDTPALLGSQRIGPDLTNTGSAEWRNEAKDDPRKPARRDAAWHYLHLYNPQEIVTESNMPPYRYLFEKRPVSGQGSAEALKLTGELQPDEGFEIVPTAEAKALVSYLLSLDRSRPLKEAKSLQETAAGSGTPASK